MGPDGRHQVAASLTAPSRRCSLSGSELWQTWTGPLPFVWALDGRLVFSNDANASAKAWDLSSSSIWAVDDAIVDRGTTFRGQALRVRITRSTRSNVKGISLSDDGRQIVAHLVRSQSDVHWVGHLNPIGTAFHGRSRPAKSPMTTWVDYLMAARGVLIRRVRCLQSPFEARRPRFWQIGISDAVRPRPMVHGRSAHQASMPAGADVQRIDGRFLLSVPIERTGRVAWSPTWRGPDPSLVISDLRPDAIRCPANLDSQVLGGVHRRSPSTCSSRSTTLEVARR